MLGSVPRWPRSRGFWERLAVGTGHVQPGWGLPRKHLCLADRKVVCRLSLGVQGCQRRKAQESSCTHSVPRPGLCQPLGNLHPLGTHS